MLLEKEIIGNTAFLSGILPEKFDRIAVEMLRNNKISGLAGTTILQIDNNKTIRYDMTGMLSLQDVRNMKFNREKILSFMGSYAEAVLNLEEYLLDPRCLILNDEKVYMNIATGQISFIYLPTENAGNVDALEYLKQKVLGMQYDQSEDSSYFLDIVNAFNSGKANDMESILELVKEIREVKEVKKATEVKEIKEIGADIKRAAFPPTPPASAPSGMKPAPGVVPEPKAPAVNIPEKKKTPLFGKKNETPKEIKPVPSGQNPLGVMIPGMENVPEPPKQSPKQPEEKAGKKSFWGKRRDKDDKKQKGIQIPEIDEIIAQTNHTAPVAGGLDFGNTVIGDDNSGKTEILGASVLSASRMVLTRKSTGQTMGMQGNDFKIGKDGKAVDFYIGDNPAVSRVHASIQQKGSDYYLIDNNSTNGTMINGVRLAPGVMAKLENNQEFCLADEWFCFRIG